MINLEYYINNRYKKIQKSQKYTQNYFDEMPRNAPKIQVLSSDVMDEC